MSAREFDLNGWLEIKGNPISKVGIFEYLGKQIDPEGQNSDIEPDKIYKIYRPEEELAAEDCLNSFRLLPFIDDHEMLGATEDGLTPAERKGIHGAIGEQIYFEDGYLKANLKIFSEKLARQIESGKKDLSIGYNCVYEMNPGVYNGSRYDGIQRNLRGNHLALVDEGRSGRDVAVLDHFVITLDTKLIKEFHKMEKETETKDAVTLESLEAEMRRIAEIVDRLAAAEEKEAEGESEDTDMEAKEKTGEQKIEDADMEAKEKTADEDMMKKSEEKAKAMDAQIKNLTKQIDLLKTNGTKLFISEITRRDQLANKLSNFIGVFDHADKTLAEVAAYGINKLGLKVPKGQEEAALVGFFAANKTNTVTYSLDSAQNNTAKVSPLDEYLEGSK